MLRIIWFCAFVLVTLRAVYGEDKEAASWKPETEKVFQWLPVDTEAVIVAQTPYVLLKKEQDGSDAYRDWHQ